MKKILNAIKATLGCLNWKHEIAIFISLFAVVVAYQNLGDTYESEFGAHPDEAAHYVTGLMIRDYIAEGIPGHPMRFAEEYYDHYPKVALGNWPPFFYMIQAAWTLPFSPSRTSVLLLMAFLTALLAQLIFHSAKKDFGPLLALFGTQLFLALPLIQKYSSLVMTEIPIALLAFIATLCFGKYLDDEKASRSIFFGLFASAAILTKGSGLYLAFVPPIALILCRKFVLLKRVAFWSSAAIVAVLCAPWTLFTLDKAKAGWVDAPWSEFVRDSIPYYANKLNLALGAALLALLFIGVAVRLFAPAKRNELSGKWAAAGALMFAVLLLQPLVPCGMEPRHLVMALPPIMMFTIAGGGWLIERLRSRLAPFPAFAAILTGVTISFLIHPFSPKNKGYSGFEGPAAIVVSDPEFAESIVLVSSDASGEGMLISEVAMREKRMGHTVRRASKLLGDSNWSGSEYQSKLDSVDALIELLEKEKIQILILDNSMRKAKRVEHHDILQKAVATHPNRFMQLAQFDATRIGRIHGRAVRVYALIPTPR
jgi:hypothetical protein